MGGPNPFLGLGLAERVMFPLHRGEELVDERAVGTRRRECAKLRERPFRSGNRGLLPCNVIRALKAGVGTDADRNSLGNVFPNSWAAFLQRVRRDPFDGCDVWCRSWGREALGCRGGRRRLAERGAKHIDAREDTDDHNGPNNEPGDRRAHGLVLRPSRPGHKYLTGPLEAVAGFDKLGSVSS
jgi:hypothetical protein